MLFAIPEHPRLVLSSEVTEYQIRFPFHERASRLQHTLDEKSLIPKSLASHLKHCTAIT